MLRMIQSLFVVLILISGCTTPYEKSYSDFRINEDTFSVTAKGNQHTSEEIVERYLFRRASEVTLANGFRFFVFVSQEDRTRVGSISSVSGQTHSYGQGNSMQSQGSGGGLTIPLVEPGKSVWIKCFKDRPASEGVVVDADKFLRDNVTATEKR